jgi:hypothetical protein
VYLLVETGAASPAPLVDVDGVAGAWWGATAGEVPEHHATAQAGDQLTYLFLADDPVAVAERLRPVLERRWADAGVGGQLAAPFHVAHAHALSRHLP